MPTAFQFILIATIELDNKFQTRELFSFKSSPIKEERNSFFLDKNILYERLHSEAGI